MAEHPIPRRRFQVREEDAHCSLKDFLARRCPEIPAGFLNKTIRKGFVRVNGQPGTLRDRLQPGQRIVLSLPEGTFLVAPNPAV